MTRLVALHYRLAAAVVFLTAAELSGGEYRRYRARDWMLARWRKRA